MLKCKDLVHQADALLAEELTRRERLALRLHLLICRHCRRYVRQLRRLLASIPGMHGEASEEEVDRVMDKLNHREPKD